MIAFVRHRSLRFTAAVSDEQFQDSDRELALLHARLLFEATRHTLECYLTGDFLPDWEDLPSSVAAQRWLFDSARTGQLPKM